MQENGSRTSPALFVSSGNVRNKISFYSLPAG